MEFIYFCQAAVFGNGQMVKGGENARAERLRECHSRLVN